MDPIQEAIKFSVDTSAIKANSLGGLLAELRSIDGAISAIHQKLGRGPTINPQFLQTPNLIREKLDKAFKQKGPYGATDVFKSLGLDDASVNQALARLDKIGGKLKGFQSSSGSFANMDAARRGSSAVFKAELAALDASVRAHQTAIGKALSGQGGTVTANGKDVAVKVDGQVALVIPGTQIQASVSGPIALQVEGSKFQVSGGVTGGGAAVQAVNPYGRDAETGRFTGSSGKKKIGEAAQPLDIGDQKGETGRILVEKMEEGIVTRRQEAITRVNELGQVVTDVHDSVEGLISTVTRSTTGNTPLQRYRASRRLMEENFRASKALLDPNDAGHGLANLYSRQASELRGLAEMEGGQFKHPAMTGLPAPVAGRVAALLEASAGTLDAKALQIFRGINAPGQSAIQALQFRQTGTMSAANWQQFLQGGYGVNTGMPSGVAASMRSYYTNQAARAQAAAQAAARRAARAAQAPKNLASQQWMRPAPYYASAPLGPFNNPLNPTKPLPPAPTPPPAPVNRIQAAFAGAFSPQSLAVHTIKAAGWATAITAIYKPLELAEYSIKRFLDLGEQTAHLSTVFRGVGGSAKDLANDVMKLAAANGRSTDEAMDSATEWARLGMTRVQINEAVRVSLMAANVAQIPVEEATKQLSALTHIYGLSVGQLEAALGMLVNTSQKFNVTTEDLFGGLDRAASAAKLGGVSLAELQGLIGATSGGIGQSGIQVGNTIKNLITQFTRPEIQTYLQSQGISTMNGGGFGNASEVLRQMFLRYQTMDSTQRRNLGTVIAGRLQTARFAGLMDEYPVAQKLAIDGQLRLNAAMETNAKIIQTIRAQLTGLESEWDRFAVNSGSQAKGAQIVRSVKNVVGAFADMTSGGDGSAQATQDAVDAAARNAINNKPLSAGRFAGVGKALSISLLNGFLLLHYLPGFKKQPGFFDILNVGREGQQPLPEELFQRNVGLSQGRMQSYALMSRLFQTASALKGVQTPAADETRTFANEYLGQLGLKSGDYTGGLDAAKKKISEETISAMTQLATRKADLDAALNRGSITGDDYKKSLEGIASATRNVTDATQEDLSAVTEIIARKQEYINLLKEQQSVMEFLGRLNSQMSTGTQTGETFGRLQTLGQTIPDLQQRIQELRDATGMGAEIESLPQYQQLTQQLSEARAEQAALSSPRYQAAVTAYDNRAIAYSRAQTESQSYAVGYTDAEKLLRQQAALTTELNRLKEQGALSDNDIARGLTLQVDLAKNHEEIQKRIVELKGQEQQILIDSTREYQKQMLLSGPGELLKRLYVGGRAQRGNVGAGEFMSLDPDSRRMFYDLRGGDAGAKNREEQFLLRGLGLSVSGQQGQAAADRSAVNGWQGRLPNPVAGMPGLGLPKEDPFMTQAMKSAAVLSDFTKGLLTATNALDFLTKKIASMPGGAPASTPSTPAPRLGVSGGFSLGSGAPSSPPGPLSIPHRDIGVLTF